MVKLFYQNIHQFVCIDNTGSFRCPAIWLYKKILKEKNENYLQAVYIYVRMEALKVISVALKSGPPPLFFM